MMSSSINFLFGRPKGLYGGGTKSLPGLSFLTQTRIRNSRGAENVRSPKKTQRQKNSGSNFLRISKSYFDLGDEKNVSDWRSSKMQLGAGGEDKWLH